MILLQLIYTIDKLCNRKHASVTLHYSFLQRNWVLSLSTSQSHRIGCIIFDNIPVMANLKQCLCYVRNTIVIIAPLTIDTCTKEEYTLAFTLLSLIIYILNWLYIVSQWIVDYLHCTSKVSSFRTTSTNKYHLTKCYITFLYRRQHNPICICNFREITKFLYYYL